VKLHVSTYCITVFPCIYKGNYSSCSVYNLIFNQGIYGAKSSVLTLSVELKRKKINDMNPSNPKMYILTPKMYIL